MKENDLFSRAARVRKEFVVGLKTIHYNLHELGDKTAADEATANLAERLLSEDIELFKQLDRIVKENKERLNELKVKFDEGIELSDREVAYIEQLFEETRFTTLSEE